MQVVRALSLVLLGFVAAGVTFRALDRQAPPERAQAVLPHEPHGAEDDRLARLEQELALLRGAVDELAGSVRESRLQAPAPQRVPVEGGTASDERVLEELRALEERLVAALRGAELASDEPAATDELLERIKAPDAAADWAALQPIVDLWHRDRDAARREVKLLTAEQVLERFGAPTDVWSNTNGITWQYARDWDPIREKFGTEIILRIPDGYVTQLAVR